MIIGLLENGNKFIYGYNIETLEYNPMCYNCKSFGKSCKGSTNKVYSGCVYKEVDESKPSIYIQILEQVK